ncbi:MAG: hypothetical protein Q9198_010305, partial [Flavoplaca austrocitrina]
RAIDNVPGPWGTVVQTAVGGALQAVPAIIGGILPAVLQTMNPATAVASVLEGVMNKSNQSLVTPTPGGTNNPTAGSAAPQPTTEMEQGVADPAYASAATVKPILDKLGYQTLENICAEE